ncbi:MAG: hypothetical protein MUF12_04065 [Sediminibacterium sp.]|nr:hypothetical protein [Sediminibacterium sp.]
MMRTKSPLSDADEIRALACQALLLELVSGGVTQVPSKDYELSMEALHRMDVVARTKIRYDRKQVLRLIQEHLAAEGLSESAAVLTREANLPPIVPSTPARTPGPSLQQRQQALNALTPSGSANATSTPVNANSGPPSTPLRFVLSNSSARQVGNGSPAAAVAKVLYKQPSSAAAQIPPQKKTVTLDKLVTEYLMNQHSRCKNPMITCPEFDLFSPHKCPERRKGSQAPWNLMARMSNRQIHPPYGGRDGASMMRRLIWSNFYPVFTYRPQSEPADPVMIQTCSFSACEQFVMAGDDGGQLRLLNIFTGRKCRSFSSSSETRLLRDVTRIAFRCLVAAWELFLLYGKP